MEILEEEGIGRPQADIDKVQALLDYQSKHMVSNEMDEAMGWRVDSLKVKFF